MGLIEAQARQAARRARDGVVDLAEYKRRRDLLQQDIEQAHEQLHELDAPAVPEPTPAVVGGFAELWPMLSVDARRDVAAALLIAVRVNPDKPVDITPRWGRDATRG